MRYKETLQLILAVVLIVVTAGGVAGEDDPLRSAARQIQAGDYDAAIRTLEAYTDENPEDGGAWITLAIAWHQKGDFEKAVEVNRRAAEIPRARATARYNEACALSLMGRTDDAWTAFQAAIEAGFLDYDLMATDTDLDALREKHTISYPPQQTYETLKARNGVELSYKVVLPRGFNSDATYPALVFFPPGSGSRSADWAVTELMGPRDDTGGWIVLYPVGPEEGWFTHPSHHALNDLLNEMKEKYSIEDGKFHLAGFGAGSRVAAMYSQMSREYFLSLTTFSGWHWETYEDEDLGAAFRNMAVNLVVGEEDAFGLELNRKIGTLMKNQGVDVSISVVADDGELLPTVRRVRIMDYIPRDFGGI